MTNIITETWNRRSLIWLLAVSDLRLRYRNSVLGFFWSFLEPLLLLTVLYIVFTALFKTEIENYVLYLLLGILFWSMFARGSMMGLQSISGKAGILTQVFVPRHTIVISAVLTSFFMMIFEMIVFFLFMIPLQFIPPITVIYIIPTIFLLSILTVSVSFGLSVLFIRFRDILSIWQVILTAGFFATPIFYDINILGENVRPYFLLNPVASIIELGRGIAIYGTFPSSETMITMFSIIAVTLVIGCLIFYKFNKSLLEKL